MVDIAGGGAEASGGGRARGASGAGGGGQFDDDDVVFKRVFARITTQNVFRRSNISHLGLHPVRRVNVGKFLEKLTGVFGFFFSISTEKS